MTIRAIEKVMLTRGCAPKISEVFSPEGLRKMAPKLGCMGGDFLIDSMAGMHRSPTM